MSLRTDAEQIIQEAIAAAQPEEAVRRALAGRQTPDRVYILAVGKAAWPMARAAWDAWGGSVAGGMVITKYGHLRGPIGTLKMLEAGHPVPDVNSFAATQQAMALARSLGAEDTVLFLLSGGGSALFECPLVEPEELQDITRQLLACGADIVEINTIRKRLSAVKGGRFAQLCSPARILSVVLSDVVGDRLDMIASGPACPDPSTAAEAEEIVRRYGLRLSDRAQALLREPTAAALENVETVITGSVRQLCQSAAATARRLGYEPVILTDSLQCSAADAGSFLASMAQYRRNPERPLAFLAGGETVVRLQGHGLGGRSQELALSAALGLAGLNNAAVFACGSDGTDGPTDAAGGFADGETAAAILRESGRSARAYLADNDSYHALQCCGGLLFTGPTGTNVNDLYGLLLRPDSEI